MQRTYTMSSTDTDRIVMLKRVSEMTMTIVEASDRLGISERQMYRILKRYRSEGISAVAHRLRGRQSNHAHDTENHEQAIRLYRERYSDYGPTLFIEKLDQYHEIHISRQTATRWLAGDGLWSGERRRRLHRKKRLRRDRIGSLVQFDGSYHDWFEGRGRECCLLVAIDDASGSVMLRFVETESNDTVMQFWLDYVQRYGIPAEAYTDGHAVYFDARRPERKTDFGRALSRLGIRHIHAHSPQAKGRVERSNRTHQDRLLKALREQNISTIAEANRYIEAVYMEEHNRRFARRDGLEDMHRSAEGIDLRTVFCVEEERHVYNDWTIMLAGTYIQLLRSEAPLPPPRTKVIVRSWLDGTLHIYWREHELAYEILSDKPKRGTRRGHTPSVDHPWRHKPVGGLRGRMRGTKALASKRGGA